MCCSGLIACHKITNQAIPRNIILPLAVAQGLNLRDLMRSHSGTLASCLALAFVACPLQMGYLQLIHRTAEQRSSSLGSRNSAEILLRVTPTRSSSWT